MVDRPRGDGDVGARAERIPPAEVRGAKARSGHARGLPYLLALDELVVLAPEEDLAEASEEPPVAHDPVLARREAREHAGLDRTGDGGQHRVEPRAKALRAETREARHVRERPRRQTDRIHDHQGHGRVTAPRPTNWSRVQAS